MNTRYTGKECEIDLCEKSIKKDCFGQNCILFFNQTNKSCQCLCSNFCNSIYCKSNGECINSKCKCYQGFYGERCEFKAKSKSIVQDEDDDDGGKHKIEASKNTALIIVLTALLFASSFIALSFIVRKRLLFKRQYQARQFYNINEFDEFDLNMENIEIRGPLYRTLKNEEDEQTNGTFEDIAHDENFKLIKSGSEDDNNNNQELTSLSENKSVTKKF